MHIHFYQAADMFLKEQWRAKNIKIKKVWRSNFISCLLFPSEINKKNSFALGMLSCSPKILLIYLLNSKPSLCAMADLLPKVCILIAIDNAMF